jgi:hypothetical protein
MQFDEDSAGFLVQLLAKQDALFVALRDPRASYWAAVWAARWGFQREGMPYESGGRDAAEWKRLQRVKDALAERGFLSQIRRGRRTAAVQLTDAGDDTARMLSAMPLSKLAFLERLSRLARHAQTSIDGWIPEVLLNEGRGWGDGHSKELALVIDEALPALARGWAESNCNLHGNVYYRLTDSGRAIAAEPSKATHAADVLPFANGVELYFERTKAELSTLHAGPFVTREIGAIPLSCSLETNGDRKAGDRKSRRPPATATDVTQA